MVTIKTNNINGRADWYHAHAEHEGRSYDAFEVSRMAAFMAVVRQLAVKRAIPVSI